VEAMTALTRLRVKGDSMPRRIHYGESLESAKQERQEKSPTERRARKATTAEGGDVSTGRPYRDGRMV
jgi:hypothetical protein